MREQMTSFCVRRAKNSSHFVFLLLFFVAHDTKNLGQILLLKILFEDLTMGNCDDTFYHSFHCLFVSIISRLVSVIMA